MSGTVFEYDRLWAGSFQPVTDVETILGGQGQLPRGTALGKVSSTGKLKICSKDSVDGSQVIYAILSTSVDTGSGGTAADIKSDIYKSGEFNEAAVIFATGDSYVNHMEEARERSIFFKAAHPEPADEFGGNPDYERGGSDGIVMPDNTHS